MFLYFQQRTAGAVAEDAGLPDTNYMFQVKSRPYSWTVIDFCELLSVGCWSDSETHKDGSLHNSPQNLHKNCAEERKTPGSRNSLEQSNKFQVMFIFPHARHRLRQLVRILETSPVSARYVCIYIYIYMYTHVYINICTHTFYIRSI